MGSNSNHMRGIPSVSGSTVVGPWLIAYVYLFICGKGICSCLLGVDMYNQNLHYKVVFNLHCDVNFVL